MIHQLTCFLTTCFLPITDNNYLLTITSYEATSFLCTILKIMYPKYKGYCSLSWSHLKGISLNFATKNSEWVLWSWTKVTELKCPMGGTVSFNRLTGGDFVPKPHQTLTAVFQSYVPVLLFWRALTNSAHRSTRSENSSRTTTNVLVCGLFENGKTLSWPFIAFRFQR